MVSLDQSLKMYSYYFGLRWQKISSSRKVTFFRMQLVGFICDFTAYAYVNLTSLFTKDFINQHSNLKHFRSSILTVSRL